jgi:ribonuclease HII
VVLMIGYPPSSTIRRDAGLYGYQRALARAGLTPVAGSDEAGRGACAGPLVVAAVILPDGKRGQVPKLADSKLLVPTTRERVYR